MRGNRAVVSVIKSLWASVQGDPIFMRHSKAGELCEHFNTLLLVADGVVVGEVPTYRGEGQAFL